MQTYSPLRWSQRPGLFQPFPSLNRSLRLSELSPYLMGHLDPARTTTHLVSLALVTKHLRTRNEEGRKRSKRKSLKEHGKSLSLVTKGLSGIGEDLISFVCLELNARALVVVGKWKTWMQ